MTDDPIRTRPPASVQYNDWVGTAAADDADALIGTPSTYDHLGLDRTRWTILGIDLTRLSGHDFFDIYALDKQLWKIEDFDQLEQFAASSGTLQVTKFTVGRDTTVGQFLDQQFKRFKVSLTRRTVAARGVELQIADEQDLPG